MYWPLDGIEKLAGGGHAQSIDFDEQLPGDAQPFVDAVGFIQVGVVDQAFPAHGGAWLLEVDSHDYFECICKLLASVFEPTGVIEGGFGIVNRAGAHDDKQPVVFALQDVAHGGTGGSDEFLYRCAGNGKELDQVLRGRQGNHPFDVLIIGSAGAFIQIEGSLSLTLRHGKFPCAMIKKSRRQEAGGLGHCSPPLLRGS